MTDISTDKFQHAVESRHGGKATLVQSVPVDSYVQGQPVWLGTVHIFDLKRHPTAKRAYAWASSIEGGNEDRFFTALHAPPIISPALAVRAAMVADALVK